MAAKINHRWRFSKRFLGLKQFGLCKFFRRRLDGKGGRSRQSAGRPEVQEVAKAPKLAETDDMSLIHLCCYAQAVQRKCGQLKVLAGEKVVISCSASGP
jgi:hypothetical protein